jgi:hypothetical protein
MATLMELRPFHIRMSGTPHSHLATKTRLRVPTHRNAFQHPFVVLYFCYLIKHTDNFTSHVVVAAADDVVLFFFYETSAHFGAMVSPLPAFRANEFLRGEDFSTHAQPQTW